MKRAVESPDAQKPITVQDIFPNLPESVNILALIGLLQLKFHHLFEEFRENKIEAKTVRERVMEYIDFNLETFTQLFGRNGMERMTSAGNFYQAVASLLLKPAEWPNPVHQFFVQYIKPPIDFNEQFFIKTGVEPGEKPHQQSLDTMRSPQALKKTLKILKSKIPASGPGAVHYEMLKNLAGNDEQAEKTLNWILVKTAWEYYEISAVGFKPEYMPYQNAAIKKLGISIRDMLGKIPLLRKIL